MRQQRSPLIDRRIPASRRSSRRGSAMVEAAMVLLPMLIVMVGVLDFGRVFFMHQTIGERVRKAARTAAIKDYDSATLSNLIVYNQTTQGSRGLFGMTASNVTASFADRGDSSQRVNVTIRNLEYKLLTPYISGTMKNLPIRVSVPLELP